MQSEPEILKGVFTEVYEIISNFGLLMKRIIYQMLPRLWGEGKFSSLDTESLGYIKGLGAGYVWLTGVIRHATRIPTPGQECEKVVKGDAGSPYAITDYYDVNPYLATDPQKRMDEFEALLHRIHESGLKVLVDFVPNHVAREYSGEMTPPGETPLGVGDDTSVHWSADNDFYYYPAEELSLPCGCNGYREYPAKASGNAFTPSPGVNDWYDTVRLNYCDFHTGTWDKMYSIVRFWASKGVDGFRCDMVEMVPPAFFKWLIPKIKAEFPGVIFVAEVYNTASYSLYAGKECFDLLYDKCGLYDTLRECVRTGCGATGITRCWQSLGDLQGYMLNFLENHDEQRIASDFFAGEASRAYAALAVSLLFNDASFMLYSGQEIGERGMQSEGFSGLDGRTSIFDSHKVPSLQRLYSEIHGNEALEANEKEVLGHYRKMLSLAVRPVFSQGRSYDLNYAQGEGFPRENCFAFLRGMGEELWLVAANFSDGDIVADISVPAEAFVYFGFGNLKQTYRLALRRNSATVMAVATAALSDSGPEAAPAG